MFFDRYGNIRFYFLAGCGIEDGTASLESNGLVDSDGFPVVAVDGGVYFLVIMSTILMRKRRQRLFMQQAEL